MNRVKIHSAQPTAMEAMGGLEAYLATVDLTPRMLELVKSRASQINGCGFCIQMHSKEAQKHGETVDRLLALPAWQHSPLFEPNERAVLALTEEVTLIANGGVSDSVYSDLQEHFSEEQIAQLIMLLVTISAWNRIAIATQMH